MEQDMNNSKKVNLKEWTVMIYMAGDNNLSVDMAYAMEQIKSVAGDTENSPNLFVYYDGNSPSIPTLYCDFSDPKRPKYVRSYMVPEKLYDVPRKQNENAAHRKSMLNFINWCVNDVAVIASNGEITYGRRANRYAFIISGHSLGFQDIGLFKDESTGKTMKMNDLYFTLAQSVATQAQLDHDVKARGLEGEDEKRERTLLIGQTFDILGFDACVMGMLEVGYQFSDIAKTMIASEGSVPSAGWTYAKILGCLTQEDETDGQSNTVAERFVRDFIKSQDAFTVGGVSVDMAAWDLSRFGVNGDLSKAFDELSFYLLACFDDRQSRIYRQMERVILKVHWKCQSYMFDQNVDLGDFCELLYLECGMLIDELGGGDDTVILKDLQECCRKVNDELQKAVILSGFSGGEYQYSNGVSVFFPWSREAYEVSRKNYEGLWFMRDIGTEKKFTWAGFLKKYLNEVTLRSSELPGHVVPDSPKYRYYSGIPLNENDVAYSFIDKALDTGGGSFEADVKMPGQRDSKMPGQRDSKMPGQRDSKMPGQKDSKMPGQRDSKMPGQKDSKMPGQRDSKMPGQKDSKMPGQRDSKMPGQRDSKLAGGSGSDRFFDTLKMFKNIESRWNISGFTKKPKESPQESEKTDAGLPA